MDGPFLRRQDKDLESTHYHTPLGPTPNGIKDPTTVVTPTVNGHVTKIASGLISMVTKT